MHAANAAPIAQNMAPLQAGPAQLPADSDPPVEADIADDFEMPTSDADKEIDEDSELCQIFRAVVCPLVVSLWSLEEIFSGSCQ